MDKLQEEAKQALINRGVDPQKAESLAAEYPPPRILTVCLNADLKANIYNKAGWIISALKKSWDTPTATLTPSPSPYRKGSLGDKLLTARSYLVHNHTRDLWYDADSNLISNEKAQSIRLRRGVVTDLHELGFID